nr:prepilin-type N-terminal cleavage/methylation domain-containing protein [Ruficoccus amylovorans]
MGRAFTLIELLASIAVIAILAAILIPVVSSTIERGRSVQCIGNLKMWASAIQSYSLDNGNEIYWYAHSDGDGNWISSGGPYRDYFGTDYRQAPQLIEEYRRCPGDDEDHVAGYAFVLPSYDDGSGGVGARFGSRTKLNAGDIANPADFLLITDAVYGSNGDISAGRGALGIENMIKPIMDGTRGQRVRHQGHANVLFADFHIGSHTYEDFEENGDRWMVLQGVTNSP